MLLRVSRLAFWLAALAAVVALAIPTGWETGLTAFAALASAVAYALWRSGVAHVRRTESTHALVPEAVPLTGSALHEAASMIEACCARAGTFEAALHGVAHILKTELGALQVKAYRVMGADETHAFISELIEVQPGFQSTEQRVHVRRSNIGQAVTTRRAASGTGGAVALPVIGTGGVVAAIELKGLQIDIDAQALTSLLALAQAELARRAETAPQGRRAAQAGETPVRLGENA